MPHLPTRLLFYVLLLPFLSYGQTQVGQINANGALLYNPTSIATWGNYAIVASQGSNALEIIDVSNPANPTHLSSVTSGPNADQFARVNSVVVSGNKAFALSARYMTVVDITNPLLPAVLSSTGITQSGNKIYLNGNYVYLIGLGVTIFDISNPTTPLTIGSIAAPSSPGQTWEACTAVGNYLYLGGVSSFEIVDVTNPSQPVVVGSLTDGTNGASLQFISSIAISGNYAFVTSTDGNAIEVLDISNPSTPYHAGIITNGQGGALLSDPYSIAITGNYAYVVSRFSNALEILDISSPTAPVHLASLSNLQGGANIVSPIFVTVANNFAYLACGLNIEVVDVTSPTSPVHKGEIVDGASGNGAKLDGAGALVVSGNYAYIQGTASSSLEIVDISNP